MGKRADFKCVPKAVPSPCMMGRGIVFRIFLAAALTALCSVAGCSTKEQPKWTPEKKKKVFAIATRQLPPEPIYNPLRWVRPPQVLPTRKVEASDAPTLMPIVHFEVTDRPLQEVALILAATASYRSYCSSQIADRKLTLNTLGTMEELAREIEKNADVNVVIDHRLREVRFLTKEFVAPQFE
jgi:hypothetical protein